MSTPAGQLASAPGTGPLSPPPGREPEFAVLGARSVRHAAAPMMALDLQVSEPSGREVYMIALSIQMMIEPARRDYDALTRERLSGLFGAPERWSVTTRSLLWAQLDVVVPAFTGSTTVAVPVACSYDLELAAAKYMHGLPGGHVPLALHFNGMIYYPDERGGLQMVLVPWACTAEHRMPVAVWRETVEHYYPDRGWVGLGSGTLLALEHERVARGVPTYDACVRALLADDDA
jgi:hypothetical protein